MDIDFAGDCLTWVVDLVCFCFGLWVEVFVWMFDLVFDMVGCGSYVGFGLTVWIAVVIMLY